MNSNKSLFSLLILYFVVLVLFSLKHFIFIDEIVFCYPDGKSSLFELISHIAPSPVQKLIFAIFLVILNSLILNFGIFKEYLEKNYRNIFPLIFSTILLLLSFEVDNFLPALVATLCVNTALTFLTKTLEKNHRNYAEYFNASFFISLGSIIYFPTIYLATILLIFIPFTQNPNKVKILFLYLLGYIIPFYLLFSFQFFNGKLESFYALFEKISYYSIDSTIISFNTFTVLCATVFITNSIKLIANDGHTGRTTKSFFNFFNISFVVVILFLFSTIAQTNFVLFPLSLLSIICTQFFSNMNRFKAFVFFVFIIACLHIQYQFNFI